MNCKGEYPSTVLLCSFYNTGIHVLSFSSHFQMVFMFSILGDKVSHVSPFSKAFWKSLDAHSGFSKHECWDRPQGQVGSIFNILVECGVQVSTWMIKSIVLNLNYYALWSWSVSV